MLLVSIWYLSDSSRMVLNTAHNSRPVCWSTNWAGSPSGRSPAWRTWVPSATTSASWWRSTSAVEGRHFLIAFLSYFSTLELANLQSTSTASWALRELHNLPNELSASDNITLNLGLTFQIIEVWYLRQRRFRFSFEVSQVWLDIVMPVVSLCRVVGHRVGCWYIVTSFVWF